MRSRYLHSRMRRYRRRAVISLWRLMTGSRRKKDIRSPILRSRNMILQDMSAGFGSGIRSVQVISSGMLWGEFYIQPFTGRCLTRAAFTFGTKIPKFQAAMEKLGAEKLPHGDAGYALELLPGFTMELLVWAGDDEFPPSAQILYSDNFEQGFAPEDRVVAGDLLISIVKTYL